MSHSDSDGKDKVICPTEEMNKPSAVVLPAEKDNNIPYGFLYPNGEINWDCSCHDKKELFGPCSDDYGGLMVCFGENGPNTACQEQKFAFRRCAQKCKRFDSKIEEKQLGESKNSSRSSNESMNTLLDSNSATDEEEERKLSSVEEQQSQYVNSSNSISELSSVGSSSM